MIDATALRARLAGIAAIYDRQASAAMADGDPKMAAACDWHRRGIDVAVAVLDQMLEREEAPAG